MIQRLVDQIIVPVVVDENHECGGEAARDVD
jgi:hypothetical protein